MKLLLLILGATGLAADKISNMGSCSVATETDPNFVYDKFARENGGIWAFKLVPNVRQFLNLNWMFMSCDPIASTGVYQTTIYQDLELQEPSTFAKEIHVETQKGRVTAIPIYNNQSTEYKMTFLAYVPGRYAYYYICSEDGALANQLVEFEMTFLDLVPGRYAYYHIRRGDGGDDTTDYRYVVGHGKLTTEEKAQIRKIEQDFGFKGNLRYVANA